MARWAEVDHLNFIKKKFQFNLQFHLIIIRYCLRFQVLVQKLLPVKPPKKMNFKRRRGVKSRGSGLVLNRTLWSDNWENICEPFSYQVSRNAALAFLLKALFRRSYMAQCEGFCEEQNCEFAKKYVRLLDKTVCTHNWLISNIVLNSSCCDNVMMKLDKSIHTCVVLITGK